jgi:(p)ppGpp synthase/HD superfamily hydrolase
MAWETSVHKARNFAIKFHGDQKYGNYPYSDHLDMVVNNLYMYEYYNFPYYEAGFLHDILEDTLCTEQELIDNFGEQVYGIVFACTGRGINRKEKQNSIIRKLQLNPQAVPVKMADRLANIQAGSKNDMYAKEMPIYSELFLNCNPKMYYEMLDVLKDNDCVIKREAA